MSRPLTQTDAALRAKPAAFKKKKKKATDPEPPISRHAPFDVWKSHVLTPFFSGNENGSWSTVFSSNCCR
jgi:hypothetical protein